MEESYSNLVPLIQPLRHAHNLQHDSEKWQDNLDIGKRAGGEPPFRLNAAAAHADVDKLARNLGSFVDKFPLYRLERMPLRSAALAQWSFFPSSLVVQEPG